MKGIIGRKISMTQVFRDDGQVVPVTVIQAGPCPIVQRKTAGKDGYEAIQLGFQEVKASRVNRPRRGHFQRHGAPLCRFLREFRVQDASRFEPGQVITVETFQVGEKVKVTAKTKGKGFTGVMRRHGFSGAPGAHGTHEYFRHGGSVGSSAFPSRVFKGMGMPGQHGNGPATIRNLEIVDVRPHENVLLIKGSVPGPNNGVVIVHGEGEFPVPTEAGAAEPEMDTEAVAGKESEAKGEAQEEEPEGEAENAK